LRRLILSGASLLSAVFLTLSAAGAQQPGATSATSVSVSGGIATIDAPPISLGIPRPPELKRDVDFWIRVYSEITTLQGFMHDERNLAIVYETLVLPAGAPGSPPRRQALNAARARWHEAIGEAIEALESRRAAATPEARRVLELWAGEATPARLREARNEVRFQLGQADRFRAGIVRSGAWEPHIARTFASLGLPPELAALPHVESSFTPTAYSKVGASGLWQFMRSTGRQFMRVDDIVDERHDPYRSTEAAARLLASNYRLLGSWPLAITAYNHGPNGMRRARAVMGTDDFGIIARRYRSPSFGFASRNFYPSFLAALTIDQDPQRFFPGVTRAPEQRAFEIEMPGYAEVARIERALGLSRAELRDLNPALRPAVWSGERFVPRGYRLRLPAERGYTANEFVGRLGAEHLFVAQIGPRSHRVARGETLQQIARKHRLSVRTLASLNGLETTAKLKYGRVLKLPETRPASLADLAARRDGGGSPAADGSL